MSLSTKDLTLAYKGGGKNGATSGGGQAVLAQANLEVSRGELVVLQGPNGSGKSTLMKALARQLRPIAGSVSLDGREIWQVPVQEFARQVAYVPQNLLAPPAMTVHELVALGRAPHQKIFQLSLSAKDEELVHSALARCGVERLKDKLVCEISGGEKQRCTIAMALTQEPHYLLLDEPTASLDFHYQIALIDLLGQLKKENIGMAVILHDLNIAARLADKVALLAINNGSPSSIYAQGSVAEVFARETLRQVFAVDIEILSGSASGQQVYLPTRLE